MNNNINIEAYLRRYIDGTLTELEKQQLEDALGHPENKKKIARLVEHIYEDDTAKDFVYDEKKVDKMIQAILLQSSQPAVVQKSDSDHTAEAGVIAEPSAMAPSPVTQSGLVKTLLRPRRIRYAAAVFTGIIGLYLFTTINDRKNISKAVVVPQIAPPNDVLPGSNKAVLTLSNGQTIALLDDGQQLITDEGVHIDNNKGALSYSKSDIVAFNTMTTPRGGQYKLTLPDGSRVWLNAASSITYPTAFKGHTRQVSITGEAYFEVSKDASKPFIVKTYKDEIMVKGTSFNVNSYSDEPAVKTSLLEGLVKINDTLLKPGYAYSKGKIINADMDQELAWKNGVFNFHHIKLKDAMRQIARWYDIEVHYTGGEIDVELGGEIGRNLTLQQLLNGLQDKDIHFKLDGKTLIISQL